MKILFINTSLEPGRDGVGDYLRRLAEEFTRHGHTIRLLALNDSFINEPQIADQVSGAVSIATLRLPAAAAWQDRLNRARDWAEAYDPAWVSVHFVPFGFHSRGLPWELAKKIRTVAGPRRIHLFCHELWVGFWRDPTLKMRWWGWVQRQLIRRMITSLRPKLIHTTNRTYQELLQKMGFKAEILPLFSTIRVFPRSGWLNQELQDLGAPPNSLLIGVFGAVHQAWNGDGWLDYFREQASQKNRVLILLGIGKVSPTARAHFLAVAAGAKVPVWAHHFGAQPEEQVSDYLQTLNCGISMMEGSMLGKSTSAAAMNEHHLRILVTRTDDQPDQAAVRARLHQSIDNFIAHLNSDRIEQLPASGSLLSLCYQQLITEFAQFGPDH